MAYVKGVWVDDDGSGTTGTPVTAARMTNIEQGIADANAVVPFAAVAGTQSTNVNLAAPALALDGGGALPAWNSRVLLLGQTNPAENGVYDYITGFTGATMTRSADANESAEFFPGREVYVLAGPYGDQQLAYVGPPNPNLGVDAITFHAPAAAGRAFAFLMAS